MYAISCYLDHVITGPSNFATGVYIGTCIFPQVPGCVQWIRNALGLACGSELPRGEGILSLEGRSFPSGYRGRTRSHGRYAGTRRSNTWYYGTSPRYVFLTENLDFKFSPEGPVDNNSVLIQVMVWRRTEQATSHAKLSYAYIRHSISMSRT